jgi:hypothetical protein
MLLKGSELLIRLYNAGTMEVTSSVYSGANGTGSSILFGFFQTAALPTLLPLQAAYLHPPLRFMNFLNGTFGGVCLKETFFSCVLANGKTWCPHHAVAL